MVASHLSMIVGAKGPTAVALKPALNALELWKTQDRIQALLGASQSTLRFRDIIEEGKILFLTLNDGSETDNLLARFDHGRNDHRLQRTKPHPPTRPTRVPFTCSSTSSKPMCRCWKHTPRCSFRSCASSAPRCTSTKARRRCHRKQRYDPGQPHSPVRRETGNLKDAENIAKAMGGQPRTAPPKTSGARHPSKAGTCSECPIGTSPAKSPTTEKPRRRSNSKELMSNRRGNTSNPIATSLNRSQKTPTGTRRTKTRPLRHSPRTHRPLATNQPTPHHPTGDTTATAHHRSTGDRGRRVGFL